LAHKSLHEVMNVISNTKFLFVYGVQYLDSNLIGPHAVKGNLRTPYYRNFLENEFLLHLEDVLHATRR
jgi:hypothetical protein